jgi:hypothetical protein
MVELTRFDADQRIAIALLAARGFEEAGLTAGLPEGFVFSLCLAHTEAEIQSAKEN